MPCKTEIAVKHLPVYSCFESNASFRREYLHRTVRHAALWHQGIISHIALPITDPHVPNLHHDDTHVTARDELACPLLSRIALLAEELCALVVGVVGEMLVTEELLLLGAGLGQARGTAYGGADAGNLGRVEVEEEGGEARGGFAGRGAAGRAAGVVRWTVGDPCARCVSEAFPCMQPFAG
jgi:hypothetical protein